ncbi:hypothetical protein ER308_02830 [Egibacter rhizosphaerae]|uniref:LppX_LprAFG lipoprotein n=1 Tax=Egibacter rhizosphaerae TaxID=1670831 RepID=A0A411YBH2_9ACTN|nr:hypothetical protein [Egibacter rhizosphaerae]QBI18603.1 hypothetical protein ER308_02830 [Egibacter rhizosphaerae]
MIGVGVLAGLALLAVACAGEGGAAERVAEAAEATGDETARLSFEVETEGGPDMAGPMTMDGEGEIDFAEHRMTMRTDLGAMMGAPGQDGMDEMEMRMIDTTMYMRMGDMGEMMGLDAEWIRLDPEAMGVDPAALMDAQPDWDPGAQLAVLKEAASEVEEVGEEEVRGESATRYAMVADLAEVSLEDIDDPDTRAALEEQMDVTGFDELPIDVWVDEQERVVRMEMTVDFSDVDPEELAPDALPDEGPEQADVDAMVDEMADMTQTTRMEFHDFGADVDIEEPEDAVDFEEAFGEMPGADF